MHPRVRSDIRQKWRPPLVLVLGGTLATVLCLPLIGVGYFKVAGNILGWGETTWLIGWMAAAATAVLGFLLWRLVLRPVWALTAHARAVTEGRDDTPPPRHFGTPEFTALAQAVSDMGQTLSNREAGIRAYSDHVTHEMKSPLTSISAAAELLDGPLDDADRAPLLEAIRRSAARMQELLDGLRRLAAAREPLGAGPAALEAVAAALRARVELQVEIHADSPVPYDSAGLLAVLEHLSQNAANHGAKCLVLAYSDRVLRVSDDGEGVATGDRGRVFDPFFTTRRDTGGTGMGLAIVRTMLEAAGATISLASSDIGTQFEIRF